jgi:hypothetical protein
VSATNLSIPGHFFNFVRGEWPQQAGYSIGSGMAKTWRGVLAKDMMKEEDIDKILAATERGFQLGGFTNFESGISRACQALERWLGLLSRIKDRDSAKRVLMESPEVPPDQLENVLSFLQNLPYMIREVIPEVAKAIPHDPGGRPISLTEPKKRQACAEIASLYGRGVRVGVAIKRVAQRFGVSERTVRRAWQERASSVPGSADQGS